MNAKMNNKEYTEAYLNWSSEGVDKSLETFDELMQAAEDRQTVESVYSILVNLQENIDNRKEPETVLELTRIINHYDTVMADAINILAGDHECLEVSTLGGDTRMVRTK